MNVCLETSSLFPLYAYTSYSVPLYHECNKIINNGGDLFVYEDSINEAKQISIISKTQEILEFIKRIHKTNRISLIRSILEYFPGHHFGNNSSRAVSLFVLDIIDDDSLDNMDFEEFQIKIKELVTNKVKSIENSLSQNPLIADPNQVLSYWNPETNMLKQLLPFKIQVLENKTPPPSFKNKDRDIFHFQQALENNTMDQLLVCDSGFINQLPKEYLNKLEVRCLKPFKIKT